MKLFRNLTLALGVAFSFSMSAQSNLTPDIFLPEGGAKVTVNGLSDNGKWAVWSRYDEDPTNFAGGRLYDISGTRVVKYDIVENVRGNALFDVSDDGTVVGGSKANLPAYWKGSNGKGTWTSLPMPKGANAGAVNSVTPDGKYGVGYYGFDGEAKMQTMGAMWDLTTNTLVDIPNLPVTDLTGEDQGQNWLTQISADGRYLLGVVSFSYGSYEGMDTKIYVYDRQNDREIVVNRDANGFERIPGYNSWDMDVAGKSLSPNGRWVCGSVSSNEDGSSHAWYFDVFNEELHIINGDNQSDAWAWSIDNNGTPLCTRPALVPYGTGYVYTDNYLFAFSDVFDYYGVNLSRSGIDNTGKPTLVSGDGLTVVFITSPDDSFIARFKEPLDNACQKIDLLKEWSASPANNAVMTNVSKVQIGFANYIQANATDYSKIELQDKDGKKIASPLANGGLSASNNVLTIQFRPVAIPEGETYTLVIPAGIISVNGRETNKNSEIRINYTGRGNGAVKATKVSPADGSELSLLDLTEEPILITYDASVRVNENAENPIGFLYIDDDTLPVSQIVFGTYNDNQIVAYPPTLQRLYKGSTYRVTIPAGIAVDLSGQGASEAFEITYKGTYVPDRSGDQYLFDERCDDYTNFMFYEGDYGTPTAEFMQMNFTYDTTPWAVVCDEDMSDMAFGSHSCYIDRRQADDWVSTRQITIPEGESAYLKFDGQSYRKNKEDILKVYVYASTSTINSLNETIVKKVREEGDLVFEERLSPGENEGLLAGEWTNYIVPLDKYSGQTIIICFVNDNTNQSMVMIDNVQVVRDISSFISLSNQTTVVDQKDIKIKGYLNVTSEAETFKGLEMNLKNNNGDVVSTISEPDIELAYGDLYQFEFPQALSLTVGEANSFSIEYTLGDETTNFAGTILDLAFETTKRVLIEKFTGRDCQFCPGGIAMMTRLENMYGDQIIPVEIHGYNASDPKGFNTLAYGQYLQMAAAPQARINRGELSAPFVQNQQGKLVATEAALTPEEAEASTYPLWMDEVAKELREPAMLNITMTPYDNGQHNFGFDVSVTSAINLEDQNIRVFGILLEDGLSDYQSNAYYQTDDELLGDWGLNGIYGQNTVTTWTFNNVARATWGTNYGGASGIIPHTLKAGENYTFKMEISSPKGFVNNVNNLKFVAILINESTGRVINSCVSSAMVPSGVEGVVDSAKAPVISTVFGGVQIESATLAQAQVYSPAGQILAQASGEGTFVIDLNGYRGVAIVKAVNADGSVSVKLVVR